MAFQIKDFGSIAASCLNYLKSVQTTITDFRVGALAPPIMEAIAVEMEELYQQMFIGLREAIPTAIYTSFNFPALAAVAASGNVRVYLSGTQAAGTIPGGTTIIPSGVALTYTSRNDVAVAVGAAYVDVYVTCTSAGAAGNLQAGTTFSLQPQPTGFVSASSTGDFTTGSDAETPAQQKARFISFINSLQRGTVSAVKYGLSLATVADANGIVIEKVIATNVVEPWINDNTQPVGYVLAYIHNGVNGASADLIAQATKILYGYYQADGTAVPGYKAAGARVDVQSATVSSLDVTGVITVTSGYDGPTVVAAVQTVIQNYLTGLNVGASAQKATLYQLAMDTDGVSNFQLAAPAADATASQSEKIMPGIITLTTQ